MPAKKDTEKTKTPKLSPAKRLVSAEARIAELEAENEQLRNRASNPFLAPLEPEAPTAV